MSTHDARSEFLTEVRPHLIVLEHAVRPLTEEDAALLDRYGAAALDLRESRLLTNEPLSVAFAETGLILPPATTVTESREAFESLCLRFRRFRLESDDDSHFSRARNRLSQIVHESGASEEERSVVTDWLKDLKTRARALDDTWVLGTVLAGSSPITPEDGLELVFNGHLFHRAFAKARDLIDMRGWQWTLIGQLYPQIDALSRIYWELAEGVGVMFAHQRLFPVGFEPTLITEISAGDNSNAE